MRRVVLTLPCMISRMVRVTLGLSVVVGDSSREAILLEEEEEVVLSGTMVGTGPGRVGVVG